MRVKDKKKTTKKISTSKLLIGFLFLNCTVIEFFTGWVTVKMIMNSLITGIAPDLTPLNTLIGVVISEIIGYAVYSLKAMKENTAGGVTYDLAMKEAASAQQQEPIDRQGVG